MTGFELETGLFLLAAAILGSIISWSVRGRQNNQSLKKMDEDWKGRFGKAVRQNEHLNSELATLKKSVAAAKFIIQNHTAVATKHQTEIDSLREKANALSKNLFVIGAQRDELKGKMSNHPNELNIAQQKIVELQTAFKKTQEIYKIQLETGAEERKVLERKIADAKSEQQSLNNLLTSARSEYDSVSSLRTSAQSKLQHLESLKGKVISLEAENAQLKHENTLAAQGAESLRRDVAELNSLKKQNKELVSCLESMESSRKQHESDARRYRSQAVQSEQISDTLRFKIGDIEKSWVEMQRAQAKTKTKKTGNGKVKIPSVFGQDKPKGESDDLTQIIGIGKVFERTLHDLGIYQFRQIAAFGPAEIARINSELKEFKGRIEHDDWIGQAKELHFKKYSESD
ncbi:MAG: hypothetical protein IIC61_05685 [Proteobacteria bacterium]|nr:hypothetical protein [Pseudomonadota bacterium]TDJ37697.1 MAG: hypothetical protein E2O53_01310 [Gammaproteobacteria bacterium]